MNRGPATTFRLPEVAELNRDIGDAYEVSELLGSGGMGAVYLARQIGLDREVAIKILPDNVEGMARRFAEEAQVLAHCNHPNIVGVYDYGKTKSGIPYIVMEHVPGGDLEARLGKGELPENDKFSWLRQICDGLAYAHSRGMAHLDIKPSNLLIDAEGNIKIADFGLAQIVGVEKTTQSGGTPIYAAPELNDPEKAIDHRADIYSMGVIIYQMLTGKVPKGLWLPPSKVDPGISSDFDKVVELALKKNPVTRYQNIVELETDLMEIFFSGPDSEAKSTVLQPNQLRTRLIWVFLGMFASQIAGSFFNIWYNQMHIISNFFEGEAFRFKRVVLYYNIYCYLPLISLWGVLVFSLLKKDRDSDAARRRVINLPWWATGIAAVGWLGAIPGLWLPLRDAGPAYLLQLSISVCIGAVIALAPGFFIVDLLSQRLLYPHFFSKKDKLWSTPGSYPLSLAQRGVFWTVSAGVCPVIALLLFVSLTISSRDTKFATGVALFCLAFGFFGAWLLARLVVDPINDLREAANRVGSGDLRTRVGFLRADELGILGYEFNRMVAGLRERKYIRETLGRSSGKVAAESLLNREGARRGEVRQVVVVAIHFEGYEKALIELPPDQAIQLVEKLQSIVVKTVERFGGVPYQSLCSFHTAVFGSVPGQRFRMRDVNNAAEALLEDLGDALANYKIAVGIGIAAGEALTGSLEGSRQRELLAIGDVVSQAAKLSETAAGEILKTPAVEEMEQK